MDYFDYKRVNNDFDLNGLVSYVEEEEHIIEWLKKYNLLINEKDITLELVRKYLLVTDGPVNKDMLDYFFIDQKVCEVLRRNDKN